MGHIKIYYICDRKQCKECSKECKYTSDIKHAVNFKKKDSRNVYFEKEVNDKEK